MQKRDHKLLTCTNIHRRSEFSFKKERNFHFEEKVRSPLFHFPTQSTKIYSIQRFQLQICIMRLNKRKRTLLTQCKRDKKKYQVKGLSSWIISTHTLANICNKQLLRSCKFHNFPYPLCEVSFGECVHFNVYCLPPLRLVNSFSFDYLLSTKKKPLCSNFRTFNSYLSFAFNFHFLLYIYFYTKWS